MLDVDPEYELTDTGTETCCALFEDAPVVETSWLSTFVARFPSWSGLTGTEGEPANNGLPAEGAGSDFISS